MGDDGSALDEGALDLTTPPILSAGSTSDNWVLCPYDNSWHGPYGHGGVVVKLKEWWPDLLITQNSGAPWSLSRILYEYGGVVDAIVYTARPRGVVDGVLEVGLYRSPDVNEVYHEDVAVYLETFDRRVRDWLSWLGALERPVPALILQGPKGIGKGLLSAAVSRYFGQSGAVDWRGICTDQFASARLVQTPFIWGDEVRCFANATQTEIFRSLTGNLEHTVRRMRTQPQTIRTALRVFWGTNEEHVLSIAGKHTSQSLDAVQSRVIAIAAGSEPAEHLAERGYWKLTGEWVDRPDGTPGKLVEHIAWLQTQRPEPSGRFTLPAHVDEELARGSYTGDSDELEIWHAVGEALINVSGRRAAFVEDGVVYVNARRLYDKWRQLHGTHRTMGLGEMAAKIRARAFTTKKRSVSYHGVDGRMVLDSYTAIGRGDPDSLARILDGQYKAEEAQPTETSNAPA